MYETKRPLVSKNESSVFNEILEEQKQTDGKIRIGSDRS
jgi:hypothetical protein